MQHLLKAIKCWQISKINLSGESYSISSGVLYPFIGPPICIALNAAQISAGIDAATGLPKSLSSVSMCSTTSHPGPMT